MTFAPCPTCGTAMDHRFWYFDADRAALIVSGCVIHLTPHEAALVGLLLKHVGKPPLHRDRLIGALFGLAEPADARANLDVHLSRVRAKLRGTRLQISNEFGTGCYSIVIAPAEAPRGNGWTQI